MRVFKYEGVGPLDDSVPVSMAPGRIIHAEFAPLSTNAKQRITIWVEVGNFHPHLVTRRFQIFGTGHTIPAGSAHLVSQLDEIFVWHLYEIIETEI